MKLGTFSPEIAAASTAELFRKARDYGFTQMQYSYQTDDGEEMLPRIPEALNREIAAEASLNGIEIVSVNGTFNMAHPDPAVREDGVARFEKVAASCGVYGCKLITLCTGSRSRERMWAPHPDNNTPEAWNDMRSSMERLVAIADKYDVYLGIEIEASNIINTPEKAKKIIDELGSSRLRIIMDAANLFLPGTAKRENVRPVIEKAIGLLAPWITLAHGKDIKEGDGLAFTCAGKGIVDFEFFLAELKKAGYRGGMVLHGIKNENDMRPCVEYMNDIAKSFG